MTAETKKLKVTQVRSGIGRPEKHKKILKALGLNKMHRTRLFEDTPAVRGALFKIQHLVSVEEVKE